MADSRLHGEVALVTGASRGIGRAIALAFAAHGADVVVNYQRSASQAREVVAQIEEMGRQAITVRADVSSPSDVEAMVSQALQAFGYIDILVNNAGIVLPFSLQEPDYEAWQRMVDVNVKGMLLCARAVAAAMRQRGGGRIVNIVVHETKGGLGYILTKAADDVLTRGLARELAPAIVVNAIAPGYIDTGYISAMAAHEQAQLKERIPLGRWGQPEDVAAVAVFLASDEARWMTGTTILVDGGETLA
jgi:3-oxoacyl-[acyl-carrier protein] reductase